MIDLDFLNYIMNIQNLRIPKVKIICLPINYGIDLIAKDFDIP
jgi:hypothetical protein